MATTGDLKDISLTSLVQMLCLEGRTVALVVRHQGEDGVIFFNDGDIVHAQTRTHTGEEAIYYLLRWPDGTFRMQDKVSTPRRTIHIPVSQLLLEAMNCIDDHATVAALPAAARSLTPSEIERDGVLENELITLLSGLEYLSTQLSQDKNKKRPPVALQILSQMANRMVELHEKGTATNRSDNFLSDALELAGNVYPQARLLQPRANRLPEQTLVNLYNGWTGDPQGRQQTFTQIAQGIVSVLQTGFTRLLEHFRAPKLTTEWREICSIFTIELQQVVQEIQF